MKGLYQYLVALHMHFYLFYFDIECLKLKLKNNKNYFQSLNMQFTEIHIPLSSFFFSTAVCGSILCPREFASWSCAFSFAE